MTKPKPVHPRTARKRVQAAINNRTDAKQFIPGADLRPDQHAGKTPTPGAKPSQPNTKKGNK